MAQFAKIRKHSRKEGRLEARVTPDQKRLIERAAELRGATVTEFVVASAQQAAARTISEYESLTLRGEASEVFVKAVLQAAAPNATARAAARRYRKQMGF